MTRRLKRRPKARRWSGFLLAALALAAAGAGALVLTAERKLSRLSAGGLGESFSTRVYGAPYRIDARRRPAAAQLMARLDRLGYRRVRGAPSRAGEYSWAEPRLGARLRGYRLPWDSQEAGLYALEAVGDGAWALRDAAGAAVEAVSLEPEVLAELSGRERVRRDPAAWEDFPASLRDAVVAAEDKRFFTHHGVDPRALLRAAWANAAPGGSLQGGSTITQQLAKNLFLSPRRTLRRKLAEAGFAFYLERRYSKREILTLYLNTIYWGQDGPVGVAGAKAAARFYFGREPRELSLAESAALAGIIRSPYRYNPWRDPAASRARRDFVLGRMREEGMIGPRELRAARAAALKVRPSQAAVERPENAFLVAEIVRRLEPAYGEDALRRQGLAVHSTADGLWQAAAHRAVRSARHQAALVALDPADGSVLALAGGKDYSQSQFNRATQALRQPGSAFKPFTYAAALEKGLTPASLLADEPREYAGPKGPWKPRNFDGVYRGTTTLREGLAFSLNAASVDLARQVGPERVAELAGRLGIRDPIEASLAVALGASEVNLLDLAAAYAPFANGGARVEPRLVTGVLDAEANVVEYSSPDRRKALDPAVAYLMTSLLETAVRDGTASSLAALGWDRPSAGKTGTTNDGRDAWFIGYTPSLLAGVWVGDDRNRPIRASGAADAVPIWARFMAEASADRTPDSFVPPEGLVRLKIDPASGLLSHAGCPGAREEWFVPGTEPARACPLHGTGVMGFLRRLFR